MRRITLPGAGVLAGVAVCLLAVKLHAVPQDAANLSPQKAMTAFSISATPPPGAVILFSGKQEQFADNFYKRYTKNPGDWTVNERGESTPKGDDLTSRMEFGDCYVHAEFKSELDANGRAVGEGNSGIGLHGRYEIQILDSFGRNAGIHDCGAIYNEKAPLVNPSRRPGEWQSLDILFRAPRFDAGGQVTEKPRATVFMNGVVVQNNEEVTGPTGIQYGELKGMVKTGPLVLQGDHSPVHFRNVWAVSL